MLRRLASHILAIAPLLGACDPAKMHAELLGNIGQGGRVQHIHEFVIEKHTVGRRTVSVYSLPNFLWSFEANTDARLGSYVTIHDFANRKRKSQASPGFAPRDRSLALSDEDVAYVMANPVVYFATSWGIEVRPTSCTDTGRKLLTLQAGPSQFVIEIDPKNGLPKEVVRSSSRGEGRYVIEERIGVAGLMLPSRIRVIDRLNPAGYLEHVRFEIDPPIRTDLLKLPIRQEDGPDAWRRQ